MIESLRRTWLRLTAWYVGVFAAVLVVLGGGLFWAVTREMKTAVDRDLEGAVEEAARAVEIRERERGILAEELVDALEELHVPGHDIYVFDGQGVPLRPQQAPDWVVAAANEALASGPLWRVFEAPGEGQWRLFARSIEAGGSRFAAVAVAEAFVLREQYPALVTAFLVAGLAALALVGIGGSLLARESLVPIERSMDRMRRFVADASHELRTPAAVLRSTAEVGLQRARSPAEYERLLSTIRDEAEGLGSLVDGLLLLAAADEGRLDVRRERLFLDDVLADVLARVHALADPKGVTVKLGAFEEAAVAGDAMLLRQLLLIILHNAVKFTPGGGWVEGSVMRTGTRCLVTVRDSGPGISAEALPHVFERFYRAAEGRSGGGAGLGLAIARVIAQAHRSHIGVESRPGEGTTVTIEFPLRSDDGDRRCRSDDPTAEIRM